MFVTNVEEQGQGILFKNSSFPAREINNSKKIHNYIRAIG
jgi:hypothetical protein